MKHYENPTIVFVRNHVSGNPEIGIGYKNVIRFYIVENLTVSSEKFRRKEIEIEPKEFQDIRNKTERLKAKHLDDDFCACGAESTGKDRGIPVCDLCWDEQSDTSVADSRKYNKVDTTIINAENRNAYDLLFDL